MAGEAILVLHGRVFVRLFAQRAFQRNVVWGYYPATVCIRSVMPARYALQTQGRRPGGKSILT